MSNERCRLPLALASVPLLMLSLSSCGTQGGMLREATTDLSPCIRKHQSREEFLQCLKVAGFLSPCVWNDQSREEYRQCLEDAEFVETYIDTDRKVVWAKRCKPSWPLSAACAWINAQFDSDWRLRGWEINSGYDGP
jgi:hypothetical protein